MELMIDGQPCDLGTAKITLPKFREADFADVDTCGKGDSIKVIVPATPHNDALMGDGCDAHTAGRFNFTPHTARLTAEGATLFAGMAVMLEASSEKGYTLELRDGGAQWAKDAAAGVFRDLPIVYQAALTPATILASWTDDKPVKFFPIVRDTYPQQNGSTDLLAAQRLLTVDDYHPFLHIATLVETIFTQAGYRLESEFIRSAWFQSLYMSGAYASHDTAALAARMAFFARRLSPASAVADYSGRVTANPDAVGNTVGNIVGTATPLTPDADGEAIPELCNNGGCFGFDGNKIVYTPTAQVSVGFEYYLKYTTEHRILSRERLTGFDSIYLGTGADMHFTLENRYEDRRNALAAGHSYLLVVFNHAAGASYRLLCTRNGVAGTIWSNFSARTAQVATAAGESVASPSLLIQGGDGDWSPYAGDWALYDGYIAECGETTVELRLQTAAELLSPSSPKYFNQIYFYGAEAGMSLTLDKTCSLQPRFSSAPGYGSVITFADVARHSIRQSELLAALQHLFNLRFLTDEARKVVRVEPADDLFGAGAVADLRTRTDFSQPVVLTDTACEIARRRTWKYRAGDGAVTRFDADAVSPLGQWSVTTDSYAAQAGEKELTNPLFAPTLNATGRFADAPSASIMQVGDRDSTQEDGTNFTPRIVRFAGMIPLPDGERWGAPADAVFYPLAAFHFTGANPFTLCFEDRDGIGGLHRYYDRQAAQENTGTRITLSLQLAPHEYETLFVPGTGMPETTSLFLLETGRGEVHATLYAIETYDPETGSARCTFNLSD